MKKRRETKQINISYWSTLALFSFVCSGFFFLLLFFILFLSFFSFFLKRLGQTGKGT